MPLITLNLPTKQPRWCSENPDNITEPGETDKDDGYAVNDYMPTNWFNWMQNLNYLWARKAAMQAISNWKCIQLDTHTNSDGGNCIFVNNSAFRFWVLYHWGTYEHVHYWLYETYLDEGSPIGLTGDSEERAIAYDSARIILSDYLAADHQLAYASYNFSFTTVDTGLDERITAVGIKREHEDDNFIICGFEDGSIYTAPVVTGSFSAATTSPGTSSIRAICYMLSSKWICCRLNGDTFTSLNDGDTWIETTNTPASIMTAVYSMDVNNEAGTVIVVGNGVTANEDIARSSDGGHTWESVDYKLNGFNTNYFYKVLHCGGGIWVAVGKTLTKATALTRKFPGILVSEDDGKTWGLVNCDMYDINIDLFDRDIKDVACDGSKLVAVDSSGNYMFYSQGLPKMLD